MSLLAALALLAWAYLVFAHGRFWQSGPYLPAAMPGTASPVAIIVPARDEAATIEAAIASLLAQDYPGPVRVILVDDASTDDTAGLARALPGADRLTILSTAPRPPGWAGKLWAVHTGIAATDEALVFLTDADIVHEPNHLATLVAAMEHMRTDMVSEMVALRCQSFAERALVPAFVYFFALLYPFARVNDPASKVAAAAGGTVLIRRIALARIGGIAAIKGALIDDVALACAVKPGGAIWLGHSTQARSIRPYPHFADIWRMIARSAYVQLNHSPLLLLGTVLGLTLIFLIPPLATFTRSDLGFAAWALMMATYLPTLRRFRRPAAWAALLPLAALFYLAATIGSAIDHHRGRGVIWKSRAYPGAGA